MIPKILFFASACITTALAFPVSAQEEERSSDQEVSGHSISGVRIAEAWRTR
jgi:hypothetical protein